LLLQQSARILFIFILAALSGIEDGNSAAEYIDTQGYELSPDARAQADIKFTYVVSCQIYGQQKQMKKQEAADIALLLQRLYRFLPFIVC
jgi:glutamine synthetase